MTAGWQVLDDDESQSISFQEVCIQIKKLVSSTMQICAPARDCELVIPYLLHLS
jgi:hypothetical protein